MQKMKSKLVEDLKKHLEETPDEVLKEEWKEVEQWADVGPSAKDFIDKNFNNGKEQRS